MPSYEKYASLRDEKGISDYQVWKDTGIATATLSDWKNGISKPKTDKLVILADYFGVSINDLLE
jgi:transcriptional regulator with XRE-family HTH domain|nr:MAG TPA: Repressor protein CI [Caudoviricetes sp.]